MFYFCPNGVFANEIEVEVLLGRALARPRISLLVVLVRAVLRRRGIRGSLRIGGRVGRFLVPFRNSKREANASLVVSSSTFRNMIPSIASALITATNAIRAVPILEGGRRTACHMRIPGVLLRREVVIEGRVASDVRRFPFVEVPGASRSKVASRMGLVPPRVVPTPSVHRLRTLPAEGPTAPRGLVVPPGN